MLRLGKDAKGPGMTRRKDHATEPPLPEPAAEALADAPMPEVAIDLQPAPKPARQRSGMFGALLGGALAAAGGFGLAHYDVFDLRPAPAPELSGEVAALKDQLAKLSAPSDDAAFGARLDALEAQVAALEARPVPEAPDLSGLTALEDRLAAIETLPEGEAASTAALAARLAGVEASLKAAPAGDTAALEAKLGAALDKLAKAEAEAAARADDAAAKAAAASRDQALQALGAAVTSGAAFSAELGAVGDPTLTAALGPMAETGVPTLAALQGAFPDGAREVLRLSRDISAEGGWTDRLLGFLAAQTEARPLTPRDGDGADAILSRAEFALGEGRVADALAELATLDASIAAPLDGWIKDANRHAAAMAALGAAGGE